MKYAVTTAWVAVAALLISGCRPSSNEVWDCWNEVEADPLVIMTESPDFEIVLDTEVDDPEEWWEDGGKIMIQVWDCVDLAWWSSAGPQKVIQVFEDQTECEYYETVWTAYYECDAREGIDVPYRDYDGDGLSPYEGDCDDDDPSVIDDNDGDGWPECADVDEDGITQQDGDCDDDSANIGWEDEDGDDTPDCWDDDGDGYTEWDGDPDDGDPTRCGVDNDFDGTDDCTDDDGDGANELEGDCNDLDAEVIDLDLDGDGTSDCRDDDGDGATELQGDCDDGDPNTSIIDLDKDQTPDCLDDDGDGLTEFEGDCDDLDPNVTVVDIDQDGTNDCVDDDGDGLTEQGGDCDDLDPEVGLIDIDQDGTADCLDDDGDGLSEWDGDCDDTDSTVGFVDINEDGNNDCVDDDGDGLSEQEGDCDDFDPDVGLLDDDEDGNSDCVDDDGDGFTELEGDCDDVAADIHPGAADICDEVDNDCDQTGEPDGDPDGGIDEDPDIEFYLDNDLDGYGDEASPVLACSVPDGYIDRGGDCEDNDPSVSPAATEIPDNGADENCDGADFIVDLYVTPDGASLAPDISAFASIQAAIDAATDGQTIGVAPGRYVEKVNFRGKGVVLLSLEGPEKTVVDGGGQESGGAGVDSVFVFLNGEGLYAAAVLKGFTITGGRGTDGAYCGFVPGNRYGGAVCSKNSSPRIEGNIIEDNEVRGSGGAMYLEGAPVEVLDNVIRWNRAGYDGAGVSLSQSDGAVRGNLIVENEAGRDGAGIYAFDSSGDIENNIIAFNVSEDTADAVVTPGKGAGICLYKAQSAIFNNLIAYNDAGDSDGGGIWIGNLEAGATLTNNTIVANSAWDEGAGLCVATGTVRAINNIIAFNESPTGANVRVYETGALDWSYNMVYLESGGSGVVGLTLEAPNLQSDPLFVDSPVDGVPLDDDYFLQVGSPAVDAGDPDPSFNDKDATLNDLGVFGGPEAGQLPFLDMTAVAEWLQASP